MIGERLKEERERLGYTQPVFAEAAGAAKRTLIEWEKGNTSPSAVQLSALMAIGVDVLYVLTGQRSTAQSPAPAEAPLNRREQVLLANYRGSDEQGRRIVEGAASAAAHKDGGKKKRQSGE